jgi:sugar lactone lactonase YvrE
MDRQAWAKGRRASRRSWSWHWAKRSLAAAMVAFLGTTLPGLVSGGPAGAGQVTSVVGDPGWTPNLDAQIGATSLWHEGATGAGVGVALIDTGVTPVAGLTSGNVVQGPDLSTTAGVAGMYGLDAYGHGTFMAGIIAGRDAGVTPGQESSLPGSSTAFVGVAPDATLVNVKVGAPDGSVDPSQVIAALDWVAAHHADPGVNIRVVNLSYGSNSTQPYLIDPVAAAVERVWKAGVVVTAAAGNDGQQSALLTDPAIDPYVIAVGANGTYGANGQRLYVTSFTNSGNLGRHVDVVAPGTSVLSLRDPGSYVDVFDPQGMVPVDATGRYFRGSGTSEATAIVSGVVALLLQHYPTLTPDLVKNVLMASATPLYGTTAGMVGAGSVSAAAADQLAGQVVAAGGQVPSGSNGVGLRALADHGGPQTWPLSTGTGSLDASRGGSVVAIDGVPLTGQNTSFGTPYDPTQQGSPTAAWDQASWGGGTWSTVDPTGATWTSHGWSSHGWSNHGWSGDGWSNHGWSGDDWSNHAWSGDTWSNHTWSSGAWDSHKWSSAMWDATDWSSHAWSGNNWGQPASMVSFKGPSGVVADRSGNIWIADTGDNEVDEFNPSGVQLRILSNTGNGSGQNGRLSSPAGLAVDAAGDLFVADTGNNQVEEFSPGGSFVAAFTANGLVANNQPGHLNHPAAVAVDDSGNVYVADTGDNRVVELNGSGSFVRAFTQAGYGSGSQSVMNGPKGVAVDAAGDVYVADTGNNQVEELTAGAALVQTWTRNGDSSLQNPGMNKPQAVALDSSGTLWVADTGNNLVEAIRPASGSETYWTTVGAGQFSKPAAVAVDSAGAVYIANLGTAQIEKASANGVLLFTYGMSSQSGTPLNSPSSVAIDAAGNVWVADTGNNRIVMSTGVGVYLPAITGDGLPNGSLKKPGGLAISPSGMLWVADTGNNRVEEFTATGAFVLAITTNGMDPATAKSTALSSPASVTTDGAGDVYVADTGNNRVEKFSSSGTFLAAVTSDGQTTGTMLLSSPSGLASDAAGDVYVADTGNNRVEEFSPSGAFVTAWDDSGTPAAATMNAPGGVALDTAGNLWVADTGNNQLDEIALATGSVTGWTNNLSGVGQGTMSKPLGVAVDSAGNVYLADTGNSQVDAFNDHNVALSTVGANATLSGPTASATNTQGDLYVADTGRNRVAEYAPGGAFVMSFNLDGNGAGKGLMSSPSGVAVDGSGNVYVADTGNNQVEEFTSLGVLLRAFTVSGITTSASSNVMKSPSGVAVDGSGNVYVADTGNNQVEEFSAGGSVVRRFTANGLISNNQPGHLNHPSAVAVDGSGNVYVADTGDNRVVELSPSGSFVRGFVEARPGTGSQSLMNGPKGVAVDGSGDVYVADTGNNQVEEFSPNGALVAAYSADGSGGSLQKPAGVAVDGAGNVVEADTGENIVVGPNGALLAPG